MKKEKIKYVEPVDYFPKNIRKKYKLGEYSEDENSSEKSKEHKNKNSTSPLP